jgi:hypothetical protein
MVGAWLKKKKYNDMKRVTNPASAAYNGVKKYFLWTGHDASAVRYIGLVLLGPMFS